MQAIPIDDLDDFRLADFRNLKQHNLTRVSGKFIVEGRILVERLIDHQFQVESILSTVKLYEDLRFKIPPETLVYLLEKKQINNVIGIQFHRGVLACAIRKPRLSLASVIDDGRQTIVICPNILDQENLGGILRSCAAFGVSAVVVGRHGADPFSRRVVRVSMGAALAIPIVEAEDLDECLCQLRDEYKFDLISAVLDDAAERLPDATRSPRTAILFGCEADGLSQAWIDRSNRRVTLRMRNGMDSLNVSTAAGVFLYHFTQCATDSTIT